MERTLYICSGLLLLFAKQNNTIPRNNDFHMRMSLKHEYYEMATVKWLFSTRFNTMLLRNRIINTTQDNDCRKPHNSQAARIWIKTVMQTAWDRLVSRMYCFLTISALWMQRCQNKQTKERVSKCSMAPRISTSFIVLYTQNGRKVCSVKPTKQLWKLIWQFKSLAEKQGADYALHCNNNKSLITSPRCSKKHSLQYNAIKIFNCVSLAILQRVLIYMIRLSRIAF